MDVTASRPEDAIVWFGGAADFEQWLEDHHDRSTGVWVKIAKPAASRPSITYVEAVEAALCFGWIDGQKAALDDEHWLQRFTPRTARSRWSKINRDRATQLIEASRMRPAGALEVDRAKADGRWARAYAGSKTATVPPDLQRELDDDPVAAAAFAALDARNRYAIIWRLNDAKRAETRARRLARFLEMLRSGGRLHD